MKIAGDSGRIRRAAPETRRPPPSLAKAANRLAAHEIPGRGRQAAGPGGRRRMPGRSRGFAESTRFPSSIARIPVMCRKIPRQIRKILQMQEYKSSRSGRHRPQHLLRRARGHLCCAADHHSKHFEVLQNVDRERFPTPASAQCQRPEWLRIA